MLPASFSRMNGNDSPEKLEPPPVHPDDDVRGLSHLGHLGDRFLADDGLVKEHVVEHGPQGVVGVGVGGRNLDRFGDGDAQTAGAVGILVEDGPAGVGDVRRAGVHGRPPGAHHRGAVGLLVEGSGDLPHLALQTEHLACQGQGAPPLARPRLGGQLADPGLGVVVGLGDRSVGLVRSRRADTFVLVVDVGRGIEFPLEAPGPVHRTGPPEAIYLTDFLGDLDVAIR